MPEQAWEPIMARIIADFRLRQSEVVIPAMGKSASEAG